MRITESLRATLFKQCLAFLILALIWTCWQESAVLGDDWQSGPGYRRLALPDKTSGKAGFSLLEPSKTGILFSNILPQSISITNQILLDGSGVTAGDVDGDGWCDLYFCAIDGHNTLYRNLGNWRFENITTQAGVTCAGLRSTGASFADLDGDGDLDLVVNTAGNGTLVFYNDGKGHFTQAPFALNLGRGGKSLALTDTDGDGYLDLYVVNYRASALMDTLDARFTFKMVDGKQTVATFNGRLIAGDPELADRFVIGPRGDFQENGEPDVLYRNTGGTNFVAVSWTDGHFLDENGIPLSKAPPDWGLSAMFHDINGDGQPDLYVCNDFQTPDRFWINQGGGKFRLLPSLAQRHSSVSSMSIDFADINRDGLDDFLVLDMMSRKHSDRMRFLTAGYALNYPLGYFEDRPQYELNTLFLNRGDQTFAEISQLSGLEAADWAWSCIFLDVDLDGWEDLLVAAGMERDGRDLDVAAALKKLRAGRQPADAEILKTRMSYPRHPDGTLAFRNQGDLTFADASQKWGFDVKGVCSAMALADLDNDGDLDVVVNSLNGPALIFRNDTTAPRVAVRLKGAPPNVHGIGARITVYGGAAPRQTQEMICAGRYLASDDALRVFGAGALTNKLRIEVAWPHGGLTSIADVVPNFLYEVQEIPDAYLPNGQKSELAKSAARVEPVATKSGPALFEDLSGQLNHFHHEQRLDDFARQPLLPNKMSQAGPGVAWFDLNGDGREDLVLGTGIGGSLSVYLNRGTNGWEKLLNQTLDQPASRPYAGLIGWNSGENNKAIIAACSNYEDAQTNGASVKSFQWSNGRLEDVLAASSSSPGPIAISDIAGKGRMSLFVGGRIVPGRYPEPAVSQLLVFNGTSWQRDTENGEIMEKVGMVNGAVFSDLDGDGYPELILACPWGPIRIFRNDKGKFSEWNVPVSIASESSSGVAGLNRESVAKLSRLQELTGWWNGVAIGDFDGDGKLDIAASNWGRNTKYEAHRSKPISLYYGDLAADNSVQMVEAYYDPLMQKTVPFRQLSNLARGLPWLRARFSSNLEYSTASIEDILGDRRESTQRLQMVWLESTVFLNRGDHFEVHALPLEAQFAPAFGICVADFDGDGNDDLFLAQNFFPVPYETPRYDAGRGLLLLGDGHGQFRAVSGQQSGILIYGEQRGAAACDFDGDGRVDLVVGQNASQTKLYRNVGAKPGLRMRVVGPPENPSGIGAVIRIKSPGKSSAAREIHAGSGYWSQDGAVQVMSQSIRGSVDVHWPGGKTTHHEIPANAGGVTIGFDGSTH